MTNSFECPNCKAHIYVVGLSNSENASLKSQLSEAQEKIENYSDEQNRLESKLDEKSKCLSEAYKLLEDICELVSLGYSHDGWMNEMRHLRTRRKAVSRELNQKVVDACCAAEKYGFKQGMLRAAEIAEFEWSNEKNSIARLDENLSGLCKRIADLIRAEASK